MINVEWEEMALQRAIGRMQDKAVYTGDFNTGLQYWKNIEAQIDLVRKYPESMQAIDPPPPHRRMAVISGEPGKGEVIVYSYDQKAIPRRIVIKGVFPFLPTKIP